MRRADKKQTNLLRNVIQSFGRFVRKYLGKSSGTDKVAQLMTLLCIFVTKSYACDQVKGNKI
jgi:hypothetical protein